MGWPAPILSRILSLLIFAVCLKGDEYEVYQEFAASEEKGLFPNIFNLATNALIWSSATCGQQQKEVYCKLVEHVFNRQPQCDVCDANDVNKRHPIEFAIDGTRKWWQSPSLANGLEYERVNITIDLRQEYQVAYIIVKSAIAPRPGTWVLEKSLDGTTYSPWQYYATSDAECMRHFGVPATIGVPRFTRDDEVICTSYYSKLDPLENGEIHTSLVNGRPTAEASSELLQQFTRARFVRLRLLSPRTLNADLMIINQHGSNNRLDMSVTRRYFYAIKDISIGGQCICYGHAESCPPDPVTGQFRCECRHNTCGESCNVCCPLFNQLPWKQGTQSHPNICQACQCFNHADRCEYDEEVERGGLSVTPEGIFEGGGRCIDCKHNTDGINCERCKRTFYRPSGITHYRQDACRPCDCDPIGSEHGECVRDETSAVSGQHPGDCICKPGFGGRRCDRCAPGYRNHPTCDPCPCNQAGSLNFDTCDEEKCVCKTNVEGIYCDRCKPGTINLNVKNPQGCQPCFCFGLSTNCSERQWGRGQIRDNMGWKLTDLSGQSSVDPKSESRELLIFNTNDHKDSSLYYWKAPASFLGNILNSYGGFLQYFVYFVPSNSGQTIPVADVIMEGNGIKLEYYSRQDFFPRENMSVQIPIKEGEGWYNSHLRVPINKDDLMRALADVKYLLVRAMYHQNQVQSSIYGLALDTAVEPQNGEETTGNGSSMQHSLVDNTMRGVEVCQCPQNFIGNSCEGCAAGYRRVNNQLYGGRCERCTCEDHSDECDPFTGRCLHCKHNTTGDRCEQCLPGHYGNPSLGGELGQCRPCACPTIENNHSAQCALTQLVVGGAAASGEDAYVCTACEDGYDGNKCEICADGYFGDPLAVNGSCKPCECSGNIDPMAIGNCNSVTGVCLRCIHNTAGDHCEQCKENHWGSALDGSCKPCGCHPKGAKEAKCDNLTGSCTCHDNYEGIHCDRCKAGHGDIENMCPPCNCNTTGALGTECDQVSGQCACKLGVFGKQCDMCQPRYFNFSEIGCQFCHCNENGSIDGGRCDNITGKCECRPNVDGNMCEKCADGFFNISSRSGCQECGCDELGSEGVHCDTGSGQCVCKKGVTGLKCERCEPNHYGLDSEGCKECQICPAPGQVCDPVTGDCVCPPNTVGTMCEKCTKNAWNHDPLKGCILCDCSEIGADGSDCDSSNGQCKCRAGYVGLKCDRCTHGHFNFPECEPCGCDVSGTDPKACGKDDSCLCDENGQCPCKKNVKGLKCDTCDASSFSLERTNPLGCTECFCFNRTNFCVQSSLVWQQVYAQDRQVVFSEPWEYYTKKHNINILKEHPARYNSYPTDATPLYWPLPRSFLGDRISSYNGFIRFKIHNDDNRRGINAVKPDVQYFRYFAQVIMIGNHRIILEHTPSEISESGRYKVRLHESQWRSRLSPDVPVTRKQLMVALQNVQGIYIRATYNYPARGDAASIKEISLDVAVWENTTETINSTALGVEMCECPQGYSGNSCQDPADGYCRKRQPDYLNSEDDLALIGYPEPCACNGHSATCDAETCRCNNCEHNTFGDFCQYCKPGYHGDALSGGKDACTKCACPLADNSFSATCVTVIYGRGYMCDACKPGYTGMYCESCVSGYFGDPNVVGGFCEECACHPNGSKHGVCDEVTGQCECIPGVTGRDCSLCQERHAFIGGNCSSCDQGCTKELMAMVDEIETTMGAQNFSGLRPVPWKRVARIENTTHGLQAILDSIKFGESGAESLISELGSQNKYVLETTVVFDKAKYLLERSNRSANQLNAVTEKAKKLVESANIKNAEVFNLVQLLKQYISQSGGKHDNSAVTNWIVEAQVYLNATKDRDTYIEKRYNRGVDAYEKAQGLLKKIRSNKFNDTSFGMLKKRLDELGEWIDSYRNTVWDVARQKTIDANRVTGVVSKRVDAFKDKVAEIQEMLARSNDSKNEAVQLIAISKNEKILSIFDDYKHLNESVLGQIEEASQKCRDETQKYEQLAATYRQEYVDKSESHSRKLESEAARLKSSFEDTKTAAADPLRASNSYMQIVEALKNASTAAEQATKAAKEAFDDAGSSMVNMVLQHKNDSLELKEKAHELSLDDLDNTRAEYSERLLKINNQIASGQSRRSAIDEDYQGLDERNDRMTSLKDITGAAEKRAKEAEKVASEVTDAAEQLGLSVSKLRGFAGQGIRNVTENVREANAEVRSAMDTVERVRTQASHDKKRITELADQIALLKEKIKQAREKAAKIYISVKSSEPGLCRRSYVSPAHPTPVNSFSLKYRPLRNVPDSLLFLTRTKSKRTQASEHIAAELRDRRIVVHWDIGSGRGKVTNTHNINFIAPTDRETWYRVDLHRVGNSMTVKVSQLQDGEGTTTVTVGKLEMNNPVIFNTVPGETKIELGCDREVAEELGFGTHKFLGTIGEMFVDDEKVPLWRFSETTKNECDGDFHPEVKVTKGHMFRDGFAQVHLPLTHPPSGPTLIIPFSAYSPDGLLYFRGNQQNGDFISVELRDGHVVFKINLGDESYASVESTKSNYNDGRSHVIGASRKGDKLHLQIFDGTNSVEQNTVDIPGRNSILNVNDEDHFVGGIPPGFNTSMFQRFDLRWSGFFGCIESVKLERAELDLENVLRWQRRSPGCSFKEDGQLEPADRTVGFNQPGFLVVHGIQLTNNSSFAFSIRTRDANATLVFQSTNLAIYRRRERQAEEEEGQGYLAFYLYRGYLVVHLGTDPSQRSKVITFRSESTYNDGQLHSIFLGRMDTSVFLRVDDREVASGTLADQTTIGTPSSQMFIGGFPEKVKPPSNELPTTEALIGCISDIFVDYRLMPILPEAYAATIGTCATEQVFIPRSSAEESLQADEHAFERKASKLSLHITEPTLSTSEQYYADSIAPEPTKNSPTHESMVSKITTTFVETTVKDDPTKSSIVKRKCGDSAQQEDGESSVRFGLSESSHSRLNFIATENQDYPNVQRYKVEFSFRTSQPTGMLWIWANYKSYTRYIFLNLIDGHLRLEVKGHKQVKSFTFKSPPLNDDTWHKVTIRKSDRENFIQVDSFPAQSVKGVPNPGVMRKRMYVGGVISRHRKQFNLTVPGFVGCIRDFIVDDIPRNLLEFKRDLVPCPIRSSSTYVHEGGFLMFDSLQTFGKKDDIHISVRFRPGVADGLILGMMSNKDPENTHVVLYLKDGLMTFELVFNEQHSDSKHIFGKDVCDGKWHNVTMHISATKISFVFDGKTERLPVETNAESIELFRSLPVSVGGISSVTAQKIGISSLLGCFQNLRLSREAVPMTKAKKTSKTVPNGCPYANHSDSL